MRKLFFGGNWKCNNTLEVSQKLVPSIIDKLEFDHEHVDVVVAPVFLHLVTVNFTKKNTHVQVAAQNCSMHGFGAYTGEVCADQIRNFDIRWVILGHSERRTHFGQTDQVVAKKIESALKSGLNVIFCFGETLAEREQGKTIQVIQRQLDAARPVIGDRWNKVVFAYEPVWAIGTGKTATTEQVDQIHKWIRGYLNKISPEAGNVRVIYGGSVTEKNCNELINVPDVDGFLVGGASLKEAFIDIVKSRKTTQ